MTPETFAIDVVIVTIVSGLFAIGAWISANRAKRQETRLAREKQEAEAWVRAQEIYQKAIETQSKQLEQANRRVIELEQGRND
jgi:TolA-binding protein